MKLIDFLLKNTKNKSQRGAGIKHTDQERKKNKERKNGEK